MLKSKGIQKGDTVRFKRPAYKKASWFDLNGHCLHTGVPFINKGNRLEVLEIVERDGIRSALLKLMMKNGCWILSGILETDIKRA